MTSVIESVRTLHVPVSMPSPVVPRGGTLVFRRVDNLVVEIGTSDGVLGTGYVWLPGTGANPADPPVAAMRAVEELVHGLAEQLLGHEVHCAELLWRLVRTRTEHHGRGLLGLAHSGLDLALWDAALKTTGQSLHQALGSAVADSPCYSNQLLDHWDDGLDGLAAAARRIVADGFRMLKIPGGTHPEEPDTADLDRVAAIRDAVGPGVELMLDVGCRWRPDQVARLAPQLAEFGLRWLEDPLPLTAPDALADLRRSIATPIATGENSFDVAQLHDLARRGALDVVIYEPMRVGGVSGAIRVAHVAELFGLPVAPHTYPDLAAQLVPAAQTGGVCEYLEWWRAMLASPATPRAGRIAPVAAPGIGLDLAEVARAGSNGRVTGRVEPAGAAR